MGKEMGELVLKMDGEERRDRWDLMKREDCVVFSDDWVQGTTKE
jgi:hypothetical protein